MTMARPGTAGATRICPHCKTTILESANVCPACRHHLRFDADTAAAPQRRSLPLQVEGTFAPQGEGRVIEYAMIVSIRNEEGVETHRQVIGVGALFGGESRTFTLSVEAVDISARPGARRAHRH
jgi:hypothetical protein